MAPRSQQLTRLWILPLGLVACADAAHRDQTRLELTEAYAIRLPFAKSVGGARSDTAGSGFSWSATEPVVTLSAHKGDRQIVIDSVGRIVQIEPQANGNLEVALAQGGTLIRHLLDSAGHSIHTDSVATELVLTGAVKIDSVWYVAGLNSEEGFSVYRIRENVASPAHYLNLEKNADGRDSLPVTAHLSSSNGQLIIALARWPFTVYRLDPLSGAITVTHPDAEPRFVSALSVPNAKWIALRGVELDSGSIHTVSDLASDSRVVFVVSRDSRIITINTYRVSLGFVSSDAKKKKLCAVRSIGSRELVCYTWKWMTGNFDGTL